MIHELVHYRFKSLAHGKEYEKRITDILRGKVWPQKMLFDKNTSQSSDKNITTSIPVVEPVVNLDYKELYQGLLKRHEELLSQLRRIRTELESYC